MADWMQMDRRALIARALMLVGAGAAASACQTLDAIAPVAPQELAGMDGLTQRQRAVLSAAAERIIPQTETAGAIAAGVPERLEGMLFTWASDETRAGYLRALETIDELPGQAASFATLPVAQQHNLLAAYDARAMGAQGRDEDYARLKDLVVTLYYMSQEALTQELQYNHVPGRWDPSIPVTPETRPWP